MFCGDIESKTGIDFDDGSFCCEKCAREKSEDHRGANDTKERRTNETNASKG